MLESRDNAWEGDEDVPFHRTSGRACWSMINRDNIRDRYRISIEVSALVRFSSMLRPTDRTRKNQSFSKIRTWIILWSFLIEPRKIRMEFSFSKTEIKLTYHRFVPTIREKIFPDVKFGKFDYNSKAISNLWNEILENENKKKIIILQSSFIIDFFWHVLLKHNEKWRGIFITFALHLVQSWSAREKIFPPRKAWKIRLYRFIEVISDSVIVARYVYIHRTCR